MQSYSGNSTELLAWLLLIFILVSLVVSALMSFVNKLLYKFLSLQKHNILLPKCRRTTFLITYTGNFIWSIIYFSLGSVSIACSIVFLLLFFTYLALLQSYSRQKKMLFALLATSSTFIFFAIIWITAYYISPIILPLFS